MRWLIALIVSFSLTLSASAAATGQSRQHGRILFIGNSLTYFGNLPAVFDALSTKNGHVNSSDMIVAPGATLTDWAKTSVVTRALHDNKYSFVVMQERGGDLMGSFGSEATKNSRQSLAVLSREIRRHGATPILLGTYQASLNSSRRIEEAEGSAARALRLVYVPVSERLRNASTSQSDLAWFASDGMHPGPDLTLLDALLLYRALYEHLPEAAGFSVEAPIYTFNSGLKPELRTAVSPAPQSGTPFGITYESTRVAAVFEDL